MSNSQIFDMVGARDRVGVCDCVGARDYVGVTLAVLHCHAAVCRRIIVGMRGSNGGSARDCVGVTPALHY